jgi:hypothetical protein
MTPANAVTQTTKHVKVGASRANYTAAAWCAGWILSPARSQDFTCINGCLGFVVAQCHHELSGQDLLLAQQLSMLIMKGTIVLPLPHQLLLNLHPYMQCSGSIDKI